MSPLPSRPSLEFYRKQAKALLKAHRSGDPVASSRILRGRSALPAVGLTDAQWAVARENGFESWPKLKRHLDVLSGGKPLCRPLTIDLGYYEGRAQGLLSVQKSGLRQALETIRQFHPRFQRASDPEIRAAGFSPDDARLVLAREHGFQDWDELSKHLRVLASGEVEEPFVRAFEAVKSGDLPLLRRLLDADPSLVTARGTNGNDLLGLASSTRQYDAVRLLLERGADVDQPNNRGWMPLHQAGYANDVTLAELLLAAGASLSGEAHGAGGTPLFFALFWGHREVSELLAKRGIVPSNLRVAAGLGRVDLLATFFDSEGRLRPEAGFARGAFRPHSGFPVWHPSDDPQEILDEAFVYAAKSGRVEALEYLLARGARIDAEPYNGAALLWAAQGSKPEAVRWLVEHGADVDQRSGMGGVREITPLQGAAWGGRTKIVDLLVSLGADPTLRDPEHHGTALGWADFHGHSETRDWMLEHCGVSLQDACRFGRLEEVRERLDADPSLVNHHDGWATPLDQAAAYGHAALVRLLLDRGAVPGIRNAEGRTPRERALERHHEEIAALLS
jgi:ankyrin repeat protein